MNLRHADNRVCTLVVDDDEGVRELLATILGDADFDVLVAADGEDALALARARAPALVLVDVQLPGLSGYEVVRRLRSELGDATAIMIISGSRTDALDRAAGLEIGADDYMLKPFDPTEVVARARALVRRTHRFAPGASGAQPEAALTPRELEILVLLARGETAPTIAAGLFITPKTVSKHIERILLKLGVHSRAEAVAAAYRGGLVDDRDNGSQEARPDQPRGVSQQG